MKGRKFSKLFKKEKVSTILKKNFLNYWRISLCIILFTIMRNCTWRYKTLKYFFLRYVL